MTKRASTKLVAFWHDESASTAVEYAILASLIAAAIVIALTTMGQKTSAAYNTVTPFLK